MFRKISFRPRMTRSGSALVMTMVFILIMSLIVLNALRASKEDTRSVYLELYKLQARYIAEGALARAKGDILTQIATSNFLGAGAFTTVEELYSNVNDRFSVASKMLPTNATAEEIDWRDTSTIQRAVWDFESDPELQIPGVSNWTAGSRTAPLGSARVYVSRSIIDSDGSTETNAVGSYQATLTGWAQAGGFLNVGAGAAGDDDAEGYATTVVSKTYHHQLTFPSFTDYLLLGNSISDCSMCHLKIWGDVGQVRADDPFEMHLGYDSTRFNRLKMWGSLYLNGNFIRSTSAGGGDAGSNPQRQENLLASPGNGMFIYSKNGRALNDAFRTDGSSGPNPFAPITDLERPLPASWPSVKEHLLQWFEPRAQAGVQTGDSQVWMTRTEQDNNLYPMRGTTAFVAYDPRNSATLSPEGSYVPYQPLGAPLSPLTATSWTRPDGTNPWVVYGGGSTGTVYQRAIDRPLDRASASSGLFNVNSDDTLIIDRGLHPIDDFDQDTIPNAFDADMDGDGIAETPRGSNNPTDLPAYFLTDAALAVHMVRLHANYIPTGDPLDGWRWMTGYDLIEWPPASHRAELPTAASRRPTSPAAPPPPPAQGLPSRKHSTSIPSSSIPASWIVGGNYPFYVVAERGGTLPTGTPMGAFSGLAESSQTAAPTPPTAYNSQYFVIAVRTGLRSQSLSMRFPNSTTTTTSWPSNLGLSRAWSQHATNSNALTENTNAYNRLVNNFTVANWSGTASTSYRTQVMNLITASNLNRVYLINSGSGNTRTFFWRSTRPDPANAPGDNRMIAGIATGDANGSAMENLLRNRFATTVGTPGEVRGVVPTPAVDAQGNPVYQPVTQRGYIFMGTRFNPINVRGHLIVRGDVVFNGNVTGRGIIVSHRNVFVPGEVRMMTPPNWDTAGDRSGDQLGFLAGGNVLVGNILHNTSARTDMMEFVWGNMVDINSAELTGATPWNYGADSPSQPTKNHMINPSYLYDGEDGGRWVNGVWQTENKGNKVAVTQNGPSRVTNERMIIAGGLSTTSPFFNPNRKHVNFNGDSNPSTSADANSLYRDFYISTPGLLPAGATRINAMPASTFGSYTGAWFSPDDFKFITQVPRTSGGARTRNVGAENQNNWIRTVEAVLYADNGVIGGNIASTGPNYLSFRGGVIGRDIQILSATQNNPDTDVKLTNNVGNLIYDPRLKDAVNPFGFPYTEEMLGGEMTMNSLPDPVDNDRNKWWPFRLTEGFNKTVQFANQ